MKKVKIIYLGHAAFLVEGSKTVIIDPFITNNPAVKIKIKDLPKIDYVLVTHDHQDHLGDAFEIVKKSKAELIAIHEVATISAPEGGVSKNAVGMNIGGTYQEDKISFTMTLALHSCFRGHPAGFVIKMDNKTIYHAGDTAFFSDMKLIGRKFKLDLALLPIGGHYTMDEEESALAAKVLKPKLAVPMHYNTWPIIKASPQKFQKLARPVKVGILEVDEVLEL